MDTLLPHHFPVRIGAVRYKQGLSPLAATVQPEPVQPEHVRPQALGASGVRYRNSFAYDGAVPWDQSMGDWLPFLRSPDNELNWDRSALVARTRDLIRNDGWAFGAINRLADSAIGGNFLPIPRPIWRALSRRLGPKYDDAWAREFASAVVAEWRQWGEDTGYHADAARQQTISQIFRQAFRSKMIDGDALAILPWHPDRAETGGYATCVQLIDADRLSNPQHGVDLAQLRAGVQIDGVGAPIGYHICRGYYGDPYLGLDSLIWDYFRRYTEWGRPIVVHHFDVDRTGQHRGAGVLTAVLPRFKMLTRYDASSLQAAILRATIGHFVTSPQTEDQVMAALGGDAAQAGANLEVFAAAMDIVRQDLNGGRPLALGGVRLPVLGFGEKIQSVTGSGVTDNFSEVEDAQIRHIASATGQAAEEISGNFKGLNYSSFRGALLQSWKTLLRRRRDFQAGFAGPVYAAFLEEVLSRFGKDLMPSGFVHDDFVENRAALTHAAWIGPARGWVDPVKEAQAAVLRMDGRLSTAEQECGENGLWWEDVLDAQAAYYRATKERGLPLPDSLGGSEVPAQTDDRKPKAA
jgi:lambda family phage portal protein